MTKTITVASIAQRHIPQHAEAIIRTASCLPMGCERLLISPALPDYWPVDDWIQTEDWGDDYRVWNTELSRFILHRLPAHIKTDYVILVQADGYAVNPAAWTDEFLKCDYIGAPMPWWECLCIKGRWNRRVGSGGFCLRSRRFLEASASLPYDGSVGEDIYVSRVRHRYFEYRGCKFAPVPLALRWCYEHRLENYPSWNPLDSFGQHGLHNGQPLYRLTHWQAFLRAAKRSERFGKFLK